MFQAMKQQGDELDTGTYQALGLVPKGDPLEYQPWPGSEVEG